MKLASLTAMRASFSNCHSAPHDTSPFRWSSSCVLLLQLVSSMDLVESSKTC
jgi:hypothetical protein